MRNCKIMIKRAHYHLAAMLQLLVPSLAIAQPLSASDLSKEAQDYARKHGNLTYLNAVSVDSGAATVEHQKGGDHISDLPKVAQDYARKHGNSAYPIAAPFNGDDATYEQQKTIKVLVEYIISDINTHTGIKQNFVPIPANISNVMAYMYNSQRVLYYNPNFILMAQNNVDPNWAVISIIAHEVGHHLMGHIFIIDENFKDRELEADEFSGFIMYRMGSSIDEALITIRTLGASTETASHPRKELRLAAIARGWQAALAVTAREAELSRRRAERHALILRPR